MTTEQRISDWMKDREDELVEALGPLIEAESTLGEAKPGMPFGEGPALALDRGLELAKKWGFAVENQEGSLPWDEPGCFALRVRGDSMINAGILSGDKVIVRPQSTADHGQIVVARIEDEATVKRLWRKNGQVLLMPENEAYQPIDGTYAEIIGIVRGVVREY